MAHNNPSMQCSVCGQWKRLVIKGDPDAPEYGLQRFYSCCGDNGEYEHLLPVCDECCKKKCPYKPKENELPILRQTDQRNDGIAGTTEIPQASAQVQEKPEQGNNES